MTVTRKDRLKAASIIKLLQGYLKRPCIAKMLNTKESYISSIASAYRRPDGTWHCPAEDIRKVLDWAASDE